ncbi:MAG: 2-oxo acid dehydrogenase subunit E2 [Planctomycetota bacterium]|nr:2-oxo acid dehydrogenase subunit E2 [Planctomycetota bacterium]
MPQVSIQIPQLGEGLQEARLIRFLKQPGESVKRDEPLYEMETDKAVTEVESPHTGVVQAWTVEEDTVHEIGAAIGTMEVDAPEFGSSDEATSAEESVVVATASTVASVATEVLAGNIGVPVPPRTRRYLKEKNLESVADQIPAAGSRLSEQDVDRYLEQQNASPTAASEGDVDFADTPLPNAQQTLNYRMARGMQSVIAVSLETDIDWASIQASREATRDNGGPTGFGMFLWCVAQAMARHPALRGSLAADGKTVRTYSHVNLGVAVALPGDELKTAMVPQADTLSQREFFEILSERIASAREGQDQADAGTTVSVSNIGVSDMRCGIPVVVAPAVATLALGTVQQQPVKDGDSFKFKPSATLTMSFDHRLINGIGAAKFLNEIRKLAAEFKFDG